MIYNKVEAVISSRNILVHLDRYGRLSSTHVAVFRFLFREIEHGKTV